METTPTLPEMLIIGITAMTSAYFLIFILYSKVGLKEISRVLHPKNKKIRVLIPARAEHLNIEETAIRARMQSYDNNDFDVVVIADGLPGTTLLDLQSTEANILQLDLEEKTDGHAIRQALKYLDPQDSDITIIVDPNHVLEFDFLEKVNHAYNTGAVAIQGRRTPKKKTSILNQLIAANEEINNSIFRQGPMRLGLYPTLLGTGMAFDTQLLHDCAQGIDGSRQLAQQLDYQMHLRGIRVNYLAEALVFMEKTKARDLFNFTLSPVKVLQRLLSTVRASSKSKLISHVIRSLMPSKLLILLLNIFAMIQLGHSYFLLTTAGFSLILAMGIPASAYKAQLASLDASLPKFLQLIFRFTGGESIARKNILFKNLPVDISHEDRHRSTANL